MTKDQIVKYAELDDAAAKCGGYVAPPGSAPDYDVIAIARYCEEHGVDQSSLSDEELSQFLVRDSNEQAA